MKRKVHLSRNIHVHLRFFYDFQNIFNKEELVGGYFKILVKDKIKNKVIEN